MPIKPEASLTASSDVPAVASPPPASDGPYERGSAIAKVKLKAQRLGLRRGPGRPLGGGGKNRPEGGGGAGDSNGEQPSGPGGNGGDPKVDAARDLYGLAVDAVKGYREIGFAVTGHEHWKQIKPERLDAGARALVDVVAKLPPGAQASVLSSLAYARIAVVGWEVFGEPIARTRKVKQTEAEEAARAEAEKNEQHTAQPA